MPAEVAGAIGVLPCSSFINCVLAFNSLPAFLAPCFRVCLLSERVKYCVKIPIGASCLLKALVPLALRAFSFVYKLCLAFNCLPAFSSLLVIRESEILCEERTAWLVLFLLVFFHFRKKFVSYILNLLYVFIYIDVYILIIKWF